MKKRGELALGLYEQGEPMRLAAVCSFVLSCVGAPNFGHAQESKFDLDRLKEEYSFVACQFQELKTVFVIRTNEELQRVEVASHPNFEVIAQGRYLTLADAGKIYQISDEESVAIENTEVTTGACWFLNDAIHDGLAYLADTASLPFTGPVTNQVSELRAKLADALSAKAEAQSREQQALDRLAAATAAREVAERQIDARAAVLRLAQFDTEKERERADKAVRQADLLNQQVEQLRRQMTSLQALLDEAQERDEATQAQLQELGQDLNRALAQAAAAERSRRELEAQLEAAAEN